MSVVCGLWSVSPAEAVVVEPMRVEAIGRPGEPLIGEFSVRNDREYPVMVTVAPDRYVVVPFSAEAVPVDPPSCAEWISVAQPTVTIGPGESAPVRYQIAVPADATREHTAAIRFDVEPAAAPERVVSLPRQATATAPGVVEPSAPGQGRLQVMLRLTIPVYVAIAGYDRPAVAIERFDVQQVPGERRLRLSVGLVNVGPIHVRPFGHVTITDQERRVVAHLPIGRSLPLLAGQRGEIPLYWKPEIPGRYTAVAVVNINDTLLEHQQTFQFVGWP